jgi:hypothetical protein
MRSTVRLGLALWLVMLACWGCAGSPDAADIPQMTFDDVKPAENFTKVIVIALTHTTASDFGRRIGDLYFRSLLDAIREQNPRLRLVTRESGRLPDIINAMGGQGGERPANALELAATARIAGLNGWAVARVETLQPVARKTGLLFFRKERYFIFAELSFSVYDPFTGAKIIDKVIESSTPVSRAEYDAMKSGRAVAIEDFDDYITDMGADIGESAAEVLEDQPWQATLIGVTGDRVFLSVGASAGLRGGDRLTVFEGRRMLDGQNGERFVVPGPEVGMIRIVHVAQGVSEARIVSTSSAAGIQTGDIAVAVR